MIDGERPIALYGVLLATDADPDTSTDEFVEEFLEDYAAQFGVDDLDLALKDKITIRNGKFTVYTYTQRIEGLHVYTSVLKIPVLLGPTEKISYVGMHLVPTPTSLLPPDVITGADAIAVVQQSPEYGDLEILSDPEKVIYETSDETLHRTWQFPGWGEAGVFLFFVDTNTGQIVGAVDQVLEAEVSGTVSGYATACCAADTPVVEVGLPGVEVMALSGDDLACPSDENTIVARGFADTDGQYGFTLEELPDQVMVRLKGEWASVFNCEGELSGPCWQAAYDGTKDEPAECAEVAGNPVDVLFNPPPHSEFETAQVNGLLVIQSAHDWLKDLQPSYTGFDKSLTCLTNTAYIDRYSAAYILRLELVTFKRRLADGTYNNMAFSTVIAHEYGHFILDQLLELDYAGSSQQGSCHEGVADAVATLIWETELVGLNYCPDCLPPFIRNVDVVAADYDFDWFAATLDCMADPEACCPDGPDGNPGACCGPGGEPVDCCAPSGCEVQLEDARCRHDSHSHEIHCKGLALAGALWDLRKEIGDADTERLFADFLFVTDGRLDESVILEVLVADDDDGDLSNGSLHAEAIRHAFIDLHGWTDPTPQPDGSVRVGWVGPVAPFEEPEEGVDYFVHYETSPPSVTLRTTEKGAHPVDYWYIGRVDPESPDPEHPEPLDLGTIHANWDGPAHDIIVEVGTDEDKPCRHLHVAEIAPQSEANWSSIQLELTGDLVGRAQCYPVTEDGPDKGAGGRIAGSVAGTAKRVFAQAIGIGRDDPGTLQVGGKVNEVTLGTIQADSALVAAGMGESVDITGDLLGTFELRGDLPGWGVIVSVSGSMGLTGGILVDGDIVWRLTIQGDVSGTILADADGDGSGSITGAVIVHGLFTGEICGANLSPGGPLPDNVHLNLAPGATICGQVPECYGDENCNDLDPCNGTEWCQGGVCQVELTDCNENDVEDLCDLAEGTSQDCNATNIPDECEPGEELALLLAGTPGHEGSLWRTHNNIVRLTFACDIEQPDVGQVEIRELLPDGEFGDDLSGSFTIAVENAAEGKPRILKIQGESQEILEHGTWYAILGTPDWAGVEEFEVQYVVQVGDAGEDGKVLFDDLSLINTGVPTFGAPDGDRRDIDGDGNILFNDLSLANENIPSFEVPKPSGH